MPQPAEFGGPRVPSGTAQSGQDPLASYFANLPADQLIGELKTRAINHWNALQNRGLPTLWRLIYAQAFGMDPNTARNATQRLEFCGPQATTVRFRIQLTRQHIKQRNQLAQGQRVAYQCVAVNDDASSLAQVPICSKSLTYVFRENKGEFALYGAAEANSYFGAGAVWQRWDVDGGDTEQVQVQDPAIDQNTGEPIVDPANGQPFLKPPRVVSKRTGAPTYDVLYPWNWSTEPNVRKAPWIETREKVSKSRLMALYPEKAEQLRRLTLRRESEPGLVELFQWDLGSTTDDVLVVKHFYHENGSDVPGGRYLGYVEDVVLWDRPCPVAEGLPIHIMCSARYFDTPFGYPESADLLSVQEMMDEMFSQGATNLLRFGNQNMWGEDGVEFDERKFAAGGNYFQMKQGQKPPQVIEWGVLPPIFEYFAEKLPRFMSDISGMNATVLGQPESNITSGVFATLMQSIAEKFVSAEQQSFDELVTDVGDTTLELIRANSDSRFAAQVSGDANIPYMRYFSSQDFAAIKRVQVERTSPLMVNIGGRFEVFEKLSALPKAERAAAALLLKTGDDSAYTQQDLSCQILIRKENEMLSRGQPAMVSKTDDHILHCFDHRASLDRLRAQDPPPQGTQEFAVWNAAITAHVQHISEHGIAWMQTDPVFAAVCSIPPPPVFEPMQGRMLPAMAGTPASAPQSPPDPNAPAPGEAQGVAAAAPGQPDGPEDDTPTSKPGTPSKSKPSRPSNGAEAA